VDEKEEEVEEEEEEEEEAVEKTRLHAYHLLAQSLQTVSFRARTVAFRLHLIILRIFHIKTCFAPLHPSSI